MGWFSTRSVLVGDPPPIRLKWFIPMGSFRFLWQRRTVSGQLLVSKRGYWSLCQKAEAFVCWSWAFRQQKILRIKRQIRKGMGHKEYPQMIIQIPTLCQEERGMWVGEERARWGLQYLWWPGREGQSGVSRRDFPRSLHKHRPLPAVRGFENWASTDAPSRPFNARWAPKFGSSASRPWYWLNRACQDVYGLFSTVGSYVS